eukprot:3913436-Rhodomonas_salina.1
MVLMLEFGKRTGKFQGSRVPVNGYPGTCTQVPGYPGAGYKCTGTRGISGPGNRITVPALFSARWVMEFQSSHWARLLGFLARILTTKGPYPGHFGLAFFG